VLGADGGLTGYACGVATKRWLLDHERDRAGNRAIELASPQLSLFAEKRAPKGRHWPTAVRPGRPRSLTPR
jgi:hypothetical protein